LRQSLPREGQRRRVDRAQLRRVLDQLAKSDVLSLDRLARSTRDLLNTLATITANCAGFRSLSMTHVSYTQMF
jgi:DNA invertase Pin-like site-specific DNA recombinase